MPGASRPRTNARANRPYNALPIGPNHGSQGPPGETAVHEHPALSAAPKRPGKTFALDRIQQQGADLLSLVDEHLQVDPNGLPLRGKRA